MTKILPLLLLVSCSIAPIFDDDGVKQTDNAPFPVLSTHKGTLGWVNKKCGTEKLGLRVAGCTVPDNWNRPEDGVRIYWIYDCRNALLHELAHAENGTKHGAFEAGHTLAMRMRTNQGKGLCLK